MKKIDNLDIFYKYCFYVIEHNLNAEIVAESILITKYDMRMSYSMKVVLDRINFNI